MLVSQGSSADVFKRVDASGRVFYTDEPKGQQYKLIFRTPKKPPSFKRMGRNRERFSPIINKLSKEFNVDSLLMHALIRTESAYNPDAISKAGAVGLMQLMPGTAKRYGVNDRHNPTENIRGGIQYFRDLLKQFNKDIRLALAAYNAGENAVIHYGNKIPPYPETQNYVTKVMAFYKS
jgi:soluble lytic murein transglycosylase-like protein